MRPQPRDWYRITNLAETPSRVDIYDEIGGGSFFEPGISASTFVADIAAVKGDLEVHINSPGGNVFEALAIYNALAQRPAWVTTVVDGLAASAASFIAQAGRLRIVAPGAMVMIHDAQGLSIGNAADMRETADLLDKASDNLAGIYATHTGRPADDWRAAMQAETWYTAQEAVEAGLADRLAERPASDDALAVAAEFDLSIFAKAPDWAGVQNAEKYSADDRKRMAANGQAMPPDGAYPIADEEDLGNAIHAVGRGGADHDTIRAHIIKRAKALGLASRIPDNWNSDGSLKPSTDNDAGQMPAWLMALTAKEAASQ
jgi:ATP-dependent Clp endopeptidase proteolytic subunit ClpP